MTISSSARLHFGFLDLSGELGRSFGSLGLALAVPETSVSARRSQEGLLAVRAPDEETRSLLRHYAGSFYESQEAAHIAERAVLCLNESVPRHVGLGSGTQLALCVVTALAALHGVSLSPWRAAAITGRGRRSGIGVESFRRGGFIADGGVAGGSVLSEPLLRQPFPSSWRAVLVLPTGSPGVNGKEEEGAFTALDADLVSSSLQICRLVMVKLLPGIIDRNLGEFGEALERIQRITGECFAPFQRGVYSSPLAPDILSALREEGAVGLGQSSWGPLLYGFMEGPAAQLAARALRRRFGRKIVGAWSVRARNSGARMKLS